MVQFCKKREKSGRWKRAIGLDVNSITWHLFSLSLVPFAEFRHVCIVRLRLTLFAVIVAVCVRAFDTRKECTFCVRMSTCRLFENRDNYVTLE